MHKQNLHTHSVFCDGKNTIEEMTQRAIELGFDSLGFSGHIYKDYAICSMSEENINAYKQEIRRVKEKYKDKIKIYLGAEYDMFADQDRSEYDYVIGSVHCIEMDGEIVDMDVSATEVKELIQNRFHGDGLALAKAYYKTMARLSEFGQFDFVGHFDLVNKHCEKQGIFDDDCKEYKDAALEALHTVAKTHKVFEVNVGAIARGYKTAPYPAPFLLKEMKALGCGVLISSDCHKKEFLDANFDLGTQYIQSCGFDEILIFDGKEFVGQKIK